MRITAIKKILEEAEATSLGGGWHLKVRLKDGSNLGERAVWSFSETGAMLILGGKDLETRDQRLFVDLESIATVEVV